MLFFFGLADEPSPCSDEPCLPFSCGALDAAAFLTYFSHQKTTRPADELLDEEARSGDAVTRVTRRAGTGRPGATPKERGSREGGRRPGSYGLHRHDAAFHRHACSRPSACTANRRRTLPAADAVAPPAPDAPDDIDNCGIADDEDEDDDGEESNHTLMMGDEAWWESSTTL